jgi:hypothetical protein
LSEILAGTDAGIFAGIRELRRAAARAGVLVVAARLDDPGLRRRIRRLRARLPGRPLLLVTAGDLDNAAFLAELEADRVVWLDQVADKLPAAIAELVRETPRRRLVARVRAAGQLAPELRAAIAEALTSDFPPRRPGGLAALAGCGERTFRIHWHRGITAATGLTRGSFLHLVLLLRLCELRVAEEPWSRAARRLGVDLPYLERIAGLELGITLGQLPADAVGSVADRLLRGLGVGGGGR